MVMHHTGGPQWCLRSRGTHRRLLLATLLSVHAQRGHARCSGVGRGGSTMQGVTGEVGAEVIQSVLAAETEGGRALSIAVVDDAGALVAFHRMAGAPRFSAD